MMRFNKALVVFEGPARIIWHNGGNGEWTPTGIWPGPRQRAVLEEHLGQGAPLLIVLDDPNATVSVLREELERAPQELHATLAHQETAGANTEEARHPDEMSELRVPFLDWLPDSLRERGADFLAESEETLARTPLALLPVLLTERKPEHRASQVRFARRLLPGALTSTRLSAAVRHLFPGGLTALCPGPADAAECAESAGFVRTPPNQGEELRR
jgi:hypothetical protein